MNTFAGCTITDNVRSVAITTTSHTHILRVPIMFTFVHIGSRSYNQTSFMWADASCHMTPSELSQMIVTIKSFNYINYTQGLCNVLVYYYLSLGLRECYQYHCVFVINAMCEDDSYVHNLM